LFLKFNFRLNLHDLFGSTMAVNVTVMSHANYLDLHVMYINLKMNWIEDSNFEQKSSGRLSNKKMMATIMLKIRMV